MGSFTSLYDVSRLAFGQFSHHFNILMGAEIGRERGNRGVVRLFVGVCECVVVGRGRDRMRYARHC